MDEFRLLRVEESERSRTKVKRRQRYSMRLRGTMPPRRRSGLVGGRQHGLRGRLAHPGRDQQRRRLDAGANHRMAGKRGGDADRGHCNAE